MTALDSVLVTCTSAVKPLPHAFGVYFTAHPAPPGGGVVGGGVVGGAVVGGGLGCR
ncbi:hypothetical protein [Micromonospora sp. NPDC023633]|uniref:hypothetical protein n=1 Tax=Micromonospora sp. NPDC023633 TaxID=3154320 RepID=UPI0033F461BC